MNWIKQNSFLSILIGSTLLICGLLTFVAMKGGSKYDEAKINYDDAYASVKNMEGLPLYPSAEYRDAKKKALDDYRQSVEELRGYFTKYQADTSKPIATQKFTENLLAANNEVLKAFEPDKETGTKVPADFFMGFEAYRGQLAKSGATSLLNYQLDVVKQILLGMADARPSELIRIYREKIPEETDAVYKPLDNDVARKFSYEIVFRGSEASVREFISKLGDKESYYCVIRSIRINNVKDVPPKMSDAKFERPADRGDSPFGAFFPATEVKEEKPATPPAGLPAPVEGGPAPVEGGPAPVEGGPAPVEGGPAPVEGGPAPVEGDPVGAPFVAPVAPLNAKPANSSRILYQVLGDEELQVFIRFDIYSFFPTKELPKP